ncbi:hypothetical protein Vafri_13498 [Volvox africanus]|nr:hypothetical protein Vafri_13498 [Volvox africanus]
MGACASRPRGERKEDAGAGVYILPNGPSVSRRYMVATPENGKKSTADMITSAFLTQTEIQPEATVSIAARLASRLRIEDKRGSAHGVNLGLAILPAAESRPDLGDRPPIAGLTAKEAAQRNSPAQVGPLQDSFELSRAEALKQLSFMQKSFKGGVGSAWASSAKKPNGVADTAAGSFSPFDGRGSSQSAGDRISGSGASGSGGMGGLDLDAEVNGGGWRRSMEVTAEGEVVPVGHGIGSRPIVNAVAAVAAGAEAAVAAGPDLLSDTGMADSFMTTGGRESSRRSEHCSTPRREDGRGSCIRTISISRMQGTPKAIAGEAGGGAAVNGADGDANRGGNTELQPETDELTSLPLPNLICGPAPPKCVGLRQGPASATGYCNSVASYIKQGSLESRPSTATSLAASRNSDLGYYLEEARFASASPLHGARPLRHNLMDSSMIRQRAGQAANKAEEAARPVPLVLDYVPAIKSQPSRGNLLMAQPSVKQRPTAGGGSYCGPLDDDEFDGGSGGGLTTRRLDYVPNKSFSRKFSHATLPSGSLLLVTGGDSSRPMSPVNSRHISGDHIGSPRTVGGDSERCFQVTRTAMAVAAATVSSSGGLPNAAPLGSPLAAARRRCGGGDGGGDGSERRVSMSASQVTVSPSTSMQRQQHQPVPVAPLPPALRNTVFYENSRRVSRSMIGPALEARPSTPLITSPGPSRLHIQKSGGSIITGGGATGGLSSVTSAPLLIGGPRSALRSDAAHGDGGCVSGDVGSGVLSGGIAYNTGGASRAAGRAARLLATVQRMGVATPEAAVVQ